MEPDNDTAVIEALQAIPGFDCQSGLKRIFGNRALYVQLIEVFFQRQPEAMHACLQAGDEESARRAAHALRGTALNMGFDTVAELADAFGAALRDNRHDEAWDIIIRLESLFERAAGAVHAVKPR